MNLALTNSRIVILFHRDDKGAVVVSDTDSEFEEKPKKKHKPAPPPPPPQGRIMKSVLT